ncbi:MAG: IS256 family transposase [Planctomycetaceae bacterium]|nr:IS256 family transposase [Planctomycetaceae bacterium]
MITELARSGAKQILAAALEQEIQEYLEQHINLRDEQGHQQVVRNGYCRPRSVLTGIGGIEVEQPRVRDKREESEREKFTSKILPPYLRKAKTLEEFIPILYLRGVSTGDMEPTLRALLGGNAKGLSPQTVSRLKMQWKEECETWSRRSLAGKNYVYVWADGVYFSPRGDESKVCMLVLLGALEDGTKEVLAISDGFRECERSWSEVLLNLKNRGLEHAPMLAIGDGSLGFWNALRKIFPTTKEQRCWFHKKGNVLTQLPNSLHGKAKNMLREIEQQPTRELAMKEMKHFETVFGAKYPKAVECLMKDQKALLTFYDFPAEHWASLKTTNPIESMFATVKHRTYKSKGCGSRETYLAMTFKLTQQAQGKWRRINAPHKVQQVANGVTFTDGEAVNPTGDDQSNDTENVVTKEKTAA